MYKLSTTSSFRSRSHRVLLVTAALAGLSGCVANSSNPTVSARTASLDNESARIDLRLTNPGGRHLTLTGIDYELSHGQVGFPVARGTWDGTVDLPARGEAHLPIDIVFDTEPVESDSTLLHMIGTLHFKDHTGFLELPSMNLTQTSFQTEILAERHQQ